MHQSVVERLQRLAPDQRGAATAPPGPVLCVAPAGSGKTTTLVARVAWLVDGGLDPGAVTVVAFNKRAAEELTARLDAALEPLGVAAAAVRVRTFHALGREMLAEAGVSIDPLIDRDELLRGLFPAATAADRGRLDLAFSRLKLDLRVMADEVAADPAPGPVARAYRGVRAGDRRVGRRRLRRPRRSRAAPAPGRRGGARPLAGAAARSSSSTRRRTSTGPSSSSRCSSRRPTTASSSSGTMTRRSMAGGSPTCGGCWVSRRRCRASGASTSRRTTAARARSWSVRSGSSNTTASGSPSGSSQDRTRPGGWSSRRTRTTTSSRTARAMASWPADDTTRAVLSRTNRELLVAVVAALDLGLPFRAPDLPLLIEDPRLDALLDRLSGAPPALPLLVALDDVRRAVRAEADTTDDHLPATDEPSLAELATALLGWAPRFRDAPALREAIDARRALLAALRRDDAMLTLATAHGTKGLEWDHVVVLADGFPGRRSVADATEPERALEEERRLAYVAWTRARRSLTLLFDPAAPSRFLLEAFTAEELGLEAADAA